MTPSGDASNPLLAADGDIWAFRRALLRWFRQHARTMPWREDPTPYRVWVSEVMLQQTQVATALPYFERFMARFPTVEALAAAPLEEVLKLWEGLGYYRRARHLHQAAQTIVENHGGVIPADEKALLALPGIGRYTAGAIRSIAFGLPAPILDGNVKRVLARLDDIAAPIDRAQTERHLWDRAAALVDPDQPGRFNQAFMELGSLVCRPRQPDCTACPVRAFCLAHARGTQAQRPVRAPRKRIPHYQVAAGVIWHRTDPRRFLIAQRPAQGMLGGLWEFPGGKQEPGESLPQTLARELREELQIDVEVGRKLTEVKHAFSHFRITLHAFHARHLAGEPQTIGVDDWRWVTVDEAAAFPMAKTDRAILASLRKDAGTE